MSQKIIVEIASDSHAKLVHRYASMLAELESISETATDGRVFEICEEAVVSRSRSEAREVLKDVVQSRIAKLEKKGRRPVDVPVAAGKTTVRNRRKKS